MLSRPGAYFKKCCGLYPPPGVIAIVNQCVHCSYLSVSSRVGRFILSVDFSITTHVNMS